MENIILLTERLKFSLLQDTDKIHLAKLLGDIEVMYAWEHAFTEEEVALWLRENIKRYHRDGYSYWAVRLKKDNTFIGVMGILKEDIGDTDFTGVAYILLKEYWKQGYAVEGASGLIDYAFKVLEKEKVTAQIKSNNIASKKVIESLGMIVEKEFDKVYREHIMPHLLYSINKKTWCKRN